MLYSIAGIGNCCGDDYFGQLSIGRKTRVQRQQKRKVKRSARRSGENCKGRTFSKFAPPLVIARKGFLLLVRLNFRKLGAKLYVAFSNPEARIKILEKWCKLGGNAALLKSTVEKVGKKLKRKGKVNGIGVVPAVATAWASAQPIILAIIPVLSAALKLVKPGSEAANYLDQAGELIEATQTDDNAEVSGDIVTLPEVTVKATRIKPYWLIVALGTGFLISKYIR